MTAQLKYSIEFASAAFTAFAMQQRQFFDALKENRPMPIDVYDAATWMAISVLTEVSIQKGGMPVEIPDFTNGRWLL